MQAKKRSLPRWHIPLANQARGEHARDAQSQLQANFFTSVTLGRLAILIGRFLDQRIHNVPDGFPLAIPGPLLHHLELKVQGRFFAHRNALGTFKLLNLLGEKAAQAYVNDLLNGAKVNFNESAKNADANKSEPAKDKKAAEDKQG